MIKITKKLIGKRAGDLPRLFLGKHWVSNGHWMVHRDLLHPDDDTLTRDKDVAAAHYACVAEDLPEDGKMVLSKATDLHRYESTEWVRNGALVMRAEVDGKVHKMFVSEHYAKLLGVEWEVWARLDPESPCFGEPEKHGRILMPLRGVDDPPAWVTKKEDT